MQRYSLLEKELRTKYGDIYRRYPDASRVVDTFLRQHCVGRYDQAEQGISRIASISVAKYVLRYWFGLLSLGKRRDKKSAVAVHLTRFPEVAEVLNDAARLESWRFLDIAHGSGSIRRYIVAASLPMLALPLSGFRAKCLLRKLESIGLSSFVYNSELMASLDQVVRCEISFAERLISFFGIEIIVLMEDNSAAAQIICEAARRQKVNCVVIAHGYIQDPYLITIAPINADKLLVWTKLQKRRLLDAIPKASHDRVACFGFPKFFTAVASPKSPTRCLALVILEPYLASSVVQNKKGAVGALTEAISILKRLRYEVRLRFHPKDRAYSAEISSILNRLNVSLSSGSLENELKLASVVLGANSSALVEAAYSGTPTFQIEEHKKFTFEKVCVVPMDGLESLLRSVRSAQPKHFFSEKNFSKSFLEFLGIGD